MHDHTDARDLLRQLSGPFFLPSPATWLEFETTATDTPGKHRCAYLLTEIEHRGRHGVAVAGVAPGMRATALSRAFWPAGIFSEWDLEAPGTFGQVCPWTGFSRGRDLADAMFLIDVINTPGLVLFNERQPHRGFARRFAQVVGSYPLKAWHEVRVDPGAIRGVTDDDGSLSGRRCLHFVRAHRRWLSENRQTLVRAHWRGDPAIGMQRTRYKVTTS